MSGFERSSNTRPPAGGPGRFSSARRNVQSRLNTRRALVLLGAALAFLVTVALIMYFKPGSTVEPQGEPAIDIFAAGPIEDFEPGTMTLFENEHFFLVRHADGGVHALYDMGAHIQARVGAGDLEALDCRGALREDEDMAAWLAAAGTPAGFETRGIWDECAGVAWNAAGEQVFGPPSGSLDRFKVEIVNGIIRVDFYARQCTNPITIETPCIITQ